MSSFPRTLEKRAAKKMGFTRQVHKLIVDPITNQPKMVRVKHGHILRPDGTDTGSSLWPHLPTQVAIMRAMQDESLLHSSTLRRP